MRQLQTPETDGDYVASLCQIGQANGLDHVGIAPAHVMRRAREALLARKSAGLSDSMAFTYRNPERSTEPQRSVKGAQAMVVAARSYVLDEPDAPDGPYAAVARYAWIDHYALLREGLHAIVRRLRADGFKAVAFADDNSVVDREAAWLAGLGWFGKNANLLVPGAGSFFVLGSVITTAPLPVAQKPAPDGCGSCSRCIDSCPTQAIVAPGVVDARRCLAWLLQRPGVFPREFRAALGTRIYGCDECQTVCPPTARFERAITSPATTAPISEAPSSEATAATTMVGDTTTTTMVGVGVGVGADRVQAWVSLLDVLGASDDELLGDYGRWYLADRNPIWIRRNALIALGNFAGASGSRVEATLTRYLSHHEPVLRAHAVWAAARLGWHHLLPPTDLDDIVLDELAAART